MTTVQEPMQPVDQCLLLFNELFELGDWVEFRCHNTAVAGMQSYWIQFSEQAVRGIAPLLNKLNTSGYSIYFGANPRKSMGGSRSADVALARCHFADIEQCTWDQLEMVLGDFPQPTAVINSGAGIHVWWRFVDPQADLQSWSVKQRQLILSLRSALANTQAKVDGCIHDPPRLMRAPGWVNAKPGRGQRAKVEHVGGAWIEDLDWNFPDPSGELLAESLKADAGHNHAQLTAGAMTPITDVNQVVLRYDRWTASQFTYKVIHGFWNKDIGRRHTIFKAAKDLAKRGKVPLVDAIALLQRAATLMHNKETPALSHCEIQDVSRQVTNAFEHPWMINDETFAATLDELLAPTKTDSNNTMKSAQQINPSAYAHARTQRAGLAFALDGTLKGIEQFVGRKIIGLNMPSMPKFTSRLFGARGLILCGGKPGCGKTVLTMQAALDAARGDANVCVVLLSCEMSRVEIITRWLSHLAGCTDREVAVSGDPKVRLSVNKASEQLAAISQTAEGNDRVFIYELKDIGRLHGSDGNELIALIEQAKQISGCSRCFTVCDPFQGIPYSAASNGEYDRDRELMAYLLAASRGTSEHDPIVVVSETTKTSWSKKPNIADMLGTGRLTYSVDTAFTMREVELAEGSALYKQVVAELKGADPVNHRLVQMKIVKGRRCTVRGNVWFILDTVRSCMAEVKDQDRMSMAYGEDGDDKD